MAGERGRKRAATRVGSVRERGISRTQSPPASRRLRPEHYRAALKAAAAAFPASNPHGVFGFAVQRRRVRGRETSYSTLSLFVERKRDDPTHPIRPVVFRHEGALFAVAPDVVATGRLAVATRGVRPTFTGLHAGAAIRVSGGHRCSGGVTCLLTLDGRPTHLLTAGHLFPPSEGTFGITAANPPTRAETEVGRLALNLLDRPGRTSRSTSIDVALVALNASGSQMAIESAARSRLPVLHPTAFDRELVQFAQLKVFLPRTGDYRPARSPRNRPNLFRVHTDCRPPHEVEGVVTTEFANNIEGNSGTILMTDEASGPGSAVGAAIGFLDALSLYEPLDRALEAIHAATGRDFKIWAARGR